MTAEYLYRLPHIIILKITIRLDKENFPQAFMCPYSVKYTQIIDFSIC